MSLRAALALGALGCFLAVTTTTAQEIVPMHPELSLIYKALKKHVGTCSHVWLEKPENPNHFSVRDKPGGAEFEFNVYRNMELVVVLNRIPGYEYQSSDGEDMCRSSEIGLDITSKDIRIAAYAMCKDRDEGDLVDRYSYGGEDLDLKRHWQDAANLYLATINVVLALCEGGK
ncbi:hypothetical protein HZC00_00210 [Candidatus Kaiserbacteria bacterium]|nr:hypothetical protein [Candidatus Kaiserbacteria bacterium]